MHHTELHDKGDATTALPEEEILIATLCHVL